MFYFYNKNDKIRITDLHQGIVWGTQIEETRRDERLINRFDYDGDYGTVLNRFPDAGGNRLSADGPRHRWPDPRLHQHPGHGPLHRNWRSNNPPQRGERVHILNQMTEVHRVRDLAA